MLKHQIINIFVLIMVLLFSCLIASSVCYANWNSALDIVLLIDDSGSMEGSKGQRNDSGRLRCEAAKLIANLCADEDRISVISFGDSAKINFSFASVKSNINIIENAIEKIRGKDNYTSMHTGLEAALNEIIDAAGKPAFTEPATQRIPVIIMLTDGNINSEDLPEGTSREEALSSINMILDECKKRNIKIMTVGLGQEGNLDTVLLKRIADNTGGAYYSSASADFLIDSYRKIFVEISDRFALVRQFTDSSELKIDYPVSANEQEVIMLITKSSKNDTNEGNFFTETSMLYNGQSSVTSIEKSGKFFKIFKITNPVPGKSGTLNFKFKLADKSNLDFLILKKLNFDINIISPARGFTGYSGSAFDLSFKVSADKSVDLSKYDLTANAEVNFPDSTQEIHSMVRNGNLFSLKFIPVLPGVYGFKILLHYREKDDIYKYSKFIQVNIAPKTRLNCFVTEPSDKAEYTKNSDIMVKIKIPDIQPNLPVDFSLKALLYKDDLLIREALLTRVENSSEDFDGILKDISQEGEFKLEINSSGDGIEIDKAAPILIRVFERPVIILQTPLSEELFDYGTVEIKAELCAGIHKIDPARINIKALVKDLLNTASTAMVINDFRYEKKGDKILYSAILKLPAEGAYSAKIEALLQESQEVIVSSENNFYYYNIKPPKLKLEKLYLEAGRPILIEAMHDIIADNESAEVYLSDSTLELLIKKPEQKKYKKLIFNNSRIGRFGSQNKKIYNFRYDQTNTPGTYEVIVRAAYPSILKNKLKSPVKNFKVSHSLSVIYGKDEKASKFINIQKPVKDVFKIPYMQTFSGFSNYLSHFWVRIKIEKSLIGSITIRPRVEIASLVNKLKIKTPAPITLTREVTLLPFKYMIIGVDNDAIQIPIKFDFITAAGQKFTDEILIISRSRVPLNRWKVMLLTILAFIVIYLIYQYQKIAKQEFTQNILLYRIENGSERQLASCSADEINIFMKKNHWYFYGNKEFFMKYHDNAGQLTNLKGENTIKFECEGPGNWFIIIGNKKEAITANFSSDFNNNYRIRIT